MAAFDLELLTRLDGGGRAHPPYGRAIRSLTAEGNFVASSAMRRALAVLESRSFAQCLAAWPHLQELARIAREKDRSLAQQLREAMHAHGYEEPRVQAA